MQAAIENTLTEYDFIAVVDASGSMATEDMSGGRSRHQVRPGGCKGQDHQA